MPPRKVTKIPEIKTAESLVKNPLRRGRPSAKKILHQLEKEIKVKHSRGL